MVVTPWCKRRPTDEQAVDEDTISAETRSLAVVGCSMRYSLCSTDTIGVGGRLSEHIQLDQ